MYALYYCFSSIVTFCCTDAKFQPYLNKIDEIDSSLGELERTVTLLDDYTLKLENKFKYLKEAKKLPFNKANPVGSV